MDGIGGHLEHAMINIHGERKWFFRIFISQSMVNNRKLRTRKKLTPWMLTLLIQPRTAIQLLGPEYLLDIQSVCFDICQNGQVFKEFVTFDS